MVSLHLFPFIQILFMMLTVANSVLMAYLNTSYHLNNFSISWVTTEVEELKKVIQALICIFRGDFYL